MKKNKNAAFMKEEAKEKEPAKHKAMEKKLMSTKKNSK